MKTKTDGQYLLKLIALADHKIKTLQELKKYCLKEMEKLNWSYTKTSKKLKHDEVGL